MARLYDLTLMLDPEAEEDRRSAILGNVQTAIEDAGKLVGIHDWGQRKMTFEIDHRPEAEYHLFQFESDDNALLERLDHNLKITDGVLRFRIIRLKPGSPPPPPPRADADRPVRDRDRDDRDERRGGRGREGRVAAARAAADAG
ncbi:MAG: small subunit ribosomal protein [Thermoleophilaceae bacterium]|jgi:small subunit ribosomal protein S6|nr:small subunit ribosomal protein [Thermoleophilaceae bacterium]